jgi:hypothetical protein
MSETIHQDCRAFVAFKVKIGDTVTVTYKSFLKCIKTIFLNKIGILRMDCVLIVVVLWID